MLWQRFEAIMSVVSAWGCYIKAWRRGLDAFSARQVALEDTQKQGVTGRFDFDKVSR